MGTYDWTRIRRVVDVAAPRDEVYRHLATGAGIVRWWTLEAMIMRPRGSLREPRDYAEAGDRYYLKWRDASKHEGRITAVSPAEKLSFTFSRNTSVEVTLHDVAGGTHVELLHTGFADDEAGRAWHVECRTAWTFYLANLKAALDHHVDLRDDSPRDADAVN